MDHCRLLCPLHDFLTQCTPTIPQPQPQARTPGKATSVSSSGQGSKMPVSKVSTRVAKQEAAMEQQCCAWMIPTRPPHAFVAPLPPHALPTESTQHREPLHRYVVGASRAGGLCPCLLCLHFPLPYNLPPDRSPHLPSSTPRAHTHTGVSGGVIQQHKDMPEESKQYLTEVERRDMEMVRGVGGVEGAGAVVSLYWLSG